MAIYYPKQYNWHTKLIQYIVIWFFLSPFYYLLFRLKVYGKENIPKDKKPFIVMPNHISNLDPPLVSCALNVPIAYMAKIELFKIPIINWLIIILGAFSVDRDKVEKTTIKAAKEIIEKGWNLGLFLEGTRSKNPGFLGEPNVGPAYIANMNNIPILPVGIIGSNKPFGPVIIKIGKPFYPEKDLEKARWQCAEKLAELTGFKLPEREAEKERNTKKI